MIKTLILIIILLALFYFLTYIEKFNTSITQTLDFSDFNDFNENLSQNEIQKIINLED